MTKAEEKRGAVVAAVWKKICDMLVSLSTGDSSLDRFAEQSAEVLGKEMARLAETCVRTMTGSQQHDLNIRLSKVEPGEYGQNLFKALTGVRMQKAEQILCDAHAYMQVHEKQVGAAKVVFQQALVAMCRDGIDKVQKYEKKKIRKFSEPGVKFFITNGELAYRAQLIPGHRVTLQSPTTNSVVLVMSGPYKGVVATSGNVGKLYRLLFPEDAKKHFNMTEHFFWHATDKLPSAPTEEAEKLIDRGTREVGKKKPRKGPDDEPATVFNKTGLTAMKWIKDKNASASWKERLSFKEVFDRLYAEEQNEGGFRDEPLRQPELPVVDEQKEEKIIIPTEAEGHPDEVVPQEPVLDGPRPTSMEAFQKERTLCLEYFSGLSEVINDHVVIAQQLRRAKATVIELEEELAKRKVKEEDLVKLREIAYRWERMYAQVPVISESSDDRKKLVDEIEGVLARITGEDAIIFNAMEENDGEES